MGRGGSWPPDHARVRHAAPVVGHDDAGLGNGDQQRRRSGGEDTTDSCAHVGLHCSAGEALGGGDDRGNMASAMASGGANSEAGKGESQRVARESEH
jgi:hypothetical protein